VRLESAESRVDYFDLIRQYDATATKKNPRISFGTILQFVFGEIFT
jgi:hypothetical protein